MENINLLKQGVYAHRGTSCLEEMEMTLESLRASIKRGYNLEIDITLASNGSLMLYHDEKNPSRLGQSFLGKKPKKSEILTFEDFLENLWEEIIEYKTKVMLDIKDYYLYSRKIEEDILAKLKKFASIEKLSRTFFCQSFNPFAVKWIKNMYPAFLVGQVGNSADKLFPKLKKTKKMVNKLLIDISNPDYWVYNASDSLEELLQYNCVKNIPIILYDIKNFFQIKKYNEYVHNFILDGHILKELFEKKLILR